MLSCCLSPAFRKSNFGSDQVSTTSLTESAVLVERTFGRTRAWVASLMNTRKHDSIMNLPAVGATVAQEWKQESFVARFLDFVAIGARCLDMLALEEEE